MQIKLNQLLSIMHHSMTESFSASSFSLLFVLLYLKQTCFELNTLVGLYSVFSTIAS